MNGEPMPPSGGANDPLLLPPITRMAGSKGYADLPDRLKELVEAGFKLHEKVYRFDAVERGLETPAPRRPNPVAAQVAQLQAAFGR
jgi:hypothetical protein